MAGNHGRLTTMADIGGVAVATRTYSALGGDHVSPRERGTSGEGRRRNRLFASPLE